VFWIPAIPAGTTLSVGVAHWLKILANIKIVDSIDFIEQALP
jgi:hypothetical protein